MMRVAFISPTNPGENAFYAIVADFMRAAARQLDVELEVLEGTYERDVMIRQSQELVARAVRPDYLLLANHMSVASEILPLCAEAGVGVLLVGEGMDRGDRLAIGPQGCATYLGEIVADDVDAGRSLADALVAEARSRRLAEADGTVHVGVLAGLQTGVSSKRFRGWKAFKETDPRVAQTGFRYSGMTDRDATSAAAMLLGAAPETKVLWCFNDTLALGAVNAAVAAGRAPGKDLLIGGIDLLEDALGAVARGAMYVSLGGHVVDGVRALLLLDEHHDKRDLAATTRTTRLEAVKADEAEGLRTFLTERGWRDVDFTRYSARHTGHASREELTLRALARSHR